MKRKVFRINIPGSINRLKLKEEELPDPGVAEVQIEVKSIGLNFADVFSILGLYSAAPKKDFIPGLEFSGIIVKKGDEVHGFEIGERVYGVTKFGGYVSHLNINIFYVLKLQENWDFQEGASFIVQALTAYYGLVKLGELNKDKTVLIHSAAGGVGLNANRIAKKIGSFTIGTVGSYNKLKLLEDEGYDKKIVRSKYLKEDIKRALENRQLDIVMDSVGGKVFKTSFNQLGPTGRIIVYGGGAFSTGKSSSNYLKLAYNFLTRPKVDPLRMIEQNRGILAFNLIWLYEKGEFLKQMLDELIELNLPKPIIGEIFTFENLPEAVKRLKSGKTTGKVVVEV